jgi:hypothetical protein
MAGWVLTFRPESLASQVDLLFVLSVRSASFTTNVLASERSIRGRIGAYTRWANTEDRYLTTRPAREGFYAKFEREVDPEARLAPQERAKRAEFARKAYYQRLALKSAQARRRRKAVRPADDIVAERQSGPRMAQSRGNADSPTVASRTSAFQAEAKSEARRLCWSNWTNWTHLEGSEHAIRTPWRMRSG